MQLTELKEIEFSSETEKEWIFFYTFNVEKNTFPRASLFEIENLEKKTIS